MGDVVIHIVLMIRIVLLKPHARSQLGDDGGYHVTIVQQNIKNPLTTEEFAQLCIDTL